MFLNKIVEFLIDLFLPKEEKVKQLESWGAVGLLDNIPPAKNFSETNEKNNLRETKAIFSYKSPLCRQAIWEIKYRANKKLIHDFSLILYDHILEDLSDLEIFDNFQKPILIPIPISRKREKERGFNQCVLIARELIKIDREKGGNNFTLDENLLFKKIDTPHQTAISNRRKRLENLKGSLSVSKTLSQKAKDQSYIIIDDVITTGATMSEAFQTLRNAGIKKFCGYALAH